MQARMSTKGALSRSNVRDLERFADRVPPIEQEIAQLWISGLTQEQIARQCSLTQSGVRYRLVRLAWRLSVLRRLPLLDPERFELDLFWLQEWERDLFQRFWFCNSQSDVARQIKNSQTAVRVALGRILGRLEREAARCVRVVPYAKALRLLLDNPCAAGWTFDQKLSLVAPVGRKGKS